MSVYRVLFLQREGWQEVGSKNFSVSVASKSKLVDNTPFLRTTSTSKKINFFLTNLLNGMNQSR